VAEPPSPRARQLSVLQPHDQTVRYVQYLVSQGWDRTHAGGALFFADPDELVSWNRLALGGPHHADVLDACDLPRESLIAYLSIAPCGCFSIAEGPHRAPDEIVIGKVTSLDPRLHSNQTWSFTPCPHER
jgi:hypothetical protein